MNSTLRVAGALLVTYLAAWAASFVVVFVLRGDSPPWHLLIDYLGGAWTFRAGEIPSFVLLVSVVLFAMVAPLVVLAMRRSSRQ